MEALVTCLTDGAGEAMIMVIPGIATRAVAATHIIASWVTAVLTSSVHPEATIQTIPDGNYRPSYTS